MIKWMDSSSFSMREGGRKEERIDVVNASSIEQLCYIRREG